MGLDVFVSFRQDHREVGMEITDIVREVTSKCEGILEESQTEHLENVLYVTLNGLKIERAETALAVYDSENERGYKMYFISKKIEGASDKTLKYYKLEIDQLIEFLGKNLKDITSDDVRYYLAKCQMSKKLSKVTLDNKRRIYNSFFSWLEDELYISRNPMRRIKKIKQDSLIKKPFTEEEIEKIRSACTTKRELAVVDLLFSSAMRLGELALLDRPDVNFEDREIVVFGKGNKERTVYLNAKAKLNLKLYLEERKDKDPALFVSARNPCRRLQKGGIELMIKTVGQRAEVQNVHPHRFRRTAATQAINRGMPIEQVQAMLGHAKIETTVRYAIVNQKNVKNSHERFMG